MGTINSTALVWTESAAPQTGANVYDLGLRQEEIARLRRIEVLERENSLLANMIAVTETEVMCLRKLLSSP